MPEAANKPRNARTRNRQQTEQLLLDACEHILLHQGPEGIGVNAVVKEAGVGKQLLYRYFGDLPGLVRAWLERGANWPTTAELIGGDADQFTALELKQKIKKIQRNYIMALRKRPIITRIMASELMHETDITQVLEHSSDTIARELTVILSDMDGMNKDDVVDLSFIFYCMLNYLAMRAVTSPNCFGINLNQNKSWNHIDALIDRLVDRYLP